jgi:osmoprotectant transport system permease protein
MKWAIENYSMILELTIRHVWLSVIPIVIGFLLALPVGWYASRHPRLRGTVLGAGSVLYTIPSLPLFVIMPSIIGTGFLSPLNVIIALSIYAVAIMVRSASDAFTAVSPAVLDSARASGYSPRQLVLRVQLPLAGPVLVAGLRVVSVSTVSLVSVGTLIGVTSLGNLFTDGFIRGFTTEIVVGVVATVIVALVFDVVLVLCGRALLPWAHVSGRSGRSR